MLVLSRRARAHRLMDNRAAGFGMDGFRQTRCGGERSGAARDKGPAGDEIGRAFHERSD